MPDLPGPPDHYDDEQRDAWLAGAATVAGLLAQQNQIIASQYGDAAADEGTSGDAEDPTACPECGNELLSSMGASETHTPKGKVCPECEL